VEDKTFLVFAVYCEGAARWGAHSRDASPPWLICDNRWNEAPIKCAWRLLCAEVCFGGRHPVFIATAPNTLISTSSNGSFVNSTKFLE
jgi:hypothetical protein